MVVVQIFLHLGLVFQVLDPPLGCDSMLFYQIADDGVTLAESELVGEVHDGWYFLHGVDLLVF